MPSFHSDQSLTALANCSKRKMPTCDILYFCSPESHSVILAVINPLFGPLWYWWMTCCVGLCWYGNIGASTRVPQQHFITSSGHQWDLHFFCKPFVTLCASVGKSCRVRASCFGFTLQVLCSWDFWTPWLRAAKMEENISAPDFGMSSGAIPMILRQRELCHSVVTDNPNLSPEAHWHCERNRCSLLNVSRVVLFSVEVVKAEQLICPWQLNLGLS